jgi:hypothetical protein
MIIDTAISFLDQINYRLSILHFGKASLAPVRPGLGARLSLV